MNYKLWKICKRFFWAGISKTLFLLKELFVGSLLSLVSDPAFPLHKQICILGTHNDTFWGQCSYDMQNSILICRGFQHNISKFVYVLYSLLRFLWFFSCFSTLVQYIIYLVINKAACGLISLRTLLLFYVLLKTCIFILLLITEHVHKTKPNQHKSSLKILCQNIHCTKMFYDSIRPPSFCYAYLFSDGKH